MVPLLERHFRSVVAAVLLNIFKLGLTDWNATEKGKSKQDIHTRDTHS